MKTLQNLQSGVIETAPCLSCERQTSEAVQYVNLGGAQLCGECARNTADAYSMAHSGQWLYRENPPNNEVYVKVVIPAALRWQVFERDDFTCKHCGVRRYLEADHIIPECRGGETILGNLQTLCKTCNTKKGRR